MMRARVSRRRSGKVDTGAAWISYSDMMAALLLVFVLVLCCSIYQYFQMLESKTAELDEKSVLLTAQADELDAQKLRLSTTRDELNAKENALISKQNELDSALTALEEQKGLLNTQSQTLAVQEATISDAQAALQEKEDALSVLQGQLADQQNRLDAATTLLQTQQEAIASQQQAMDTQQRRLDDLVGVRTKIIQALSDALSAANLKASVDKNTGDIVLESAVFFDVAKDTIKDSGKTLLNQFIPVYLSVLLAPEYIDYLGEIIIEGHTDTQGTYLMNLALSQERALSVATYCLQMPQLTEQQQEMLRAILTAKGRSYSDPVYKADGSVDMDASRRVEFKFRMKDSEMIDEIRGILAD